MARQKLSKTLRGKSTSSLSGRSERKTPAEIRKAKAIAANKKAAAKAAKAKKSKKPTSVRFRKNYEVKEGASGDPVTNRSAKISRQVGTQGEKVSTGGRQIGPGGVSAKEQPGFVAPVSKGGRKRAKRVVELEAKKRNNTATKKELAELKRLDELSAQAENKRRQNISKGLAAKGTKARQANLAKITFGEKPETPSNKRSGSIDTGTGEVIGNPTKEQEEAFKRNVAARNRQENMTDKQLESQAIKEEQKDRTKKGNSKVGRRKRVVGQKGATKTAAKTAQVKRQAGGKAIPQGDKGKGVRALAASGPKGKQAAKDMGFAIAKKGGRIVAAMKGGQIVSMMYDD